jgi:hypothetical protein
MEERRSRVIRQTSVKEPRRPFRRRLRKNLFTRLKKLFWRDA